VGDRVYAPPTASKVSIGHYDPRGSGAPKIGGMLQAARLSLSEARFIAGSWKNARRTGIDAAAEWRA